MQQIEFIVQKDLEPFVNCIMIGENQHPNDHTSIPLYADGYPGIMFQQSTNGFYLMPKEKKLSEFFLYGQTLNPSSLEVKGAYKYIVFQLYPFASKYLLNVDPKVLNEDCYDLLLLPHIQQKKYQEQLAAAKHLEEQVALVSQLMLELIALHNIPPNDQIQQAIALILKHNGQIKIKDVLNKIYLTERTFERNFMAQVGLSPKQFAKIIQFQCSLHQLNQNNFKKLTEVGLDSGFTDQSHFIRAFKKYTGQTPSYYLKQLSTV